MTLETRTLGGATWGQPWQAAAEQPPLRAGSLGLEEGPGHPVRPCDISQRLPAVSLPALGRRERRSCSSGRCLWVPPPSLLWVLFLRMSSPGDCAVNRCPVVTQRDTRCSPWGASCGTRCCGRPRVTLLQGPALPLGPVTVGKAPLSGHRSRLFSQPVGATLSPSRCLTAYKGFAHTVFCFYTWQLGKLSSKTVNIPPTILVPKSLCHTF